MKKSFIKRLIALALVIVSVFSISSVAMADYRPWQDEWCAHTLLPDTEPEEGTDLREQIANFQRALCELRVRYYAAFGPNGNYSYNSLSPDGIYGDQTTAAVKQVQRYFGLTVDGKAGVQTKNCIWNALGRTPSAD